MLSLKYKNNVFKPLLYEKIVPLDISELLSNEDLAVNIIEKIRKSSHKDVLIKKDGATTLLYILKDLGYNTSKTPSEILHGVDSNENSLSMFGTFDVYELGQHGGEISNYEDEMVIQVYTTDAKYPSSFLNTKEKYFTDNKPKTEIINYIKDELKNINKVIKKNTNNKEKIDVEKADYKSEDSLRNLQNYTDKDFDKGGEKDNKGLDHKHLLKSSGKTPYRFTPSKLVADEKYRSIPELKEKVQGTLRNFDKQQEKSNKFSPYMLASSVVYELIGDPFKNVDINSSLFDSNSKIKSLYEKSKIDLDFKGKEEKNMTYNYNQTEIIHKFLLSIVTDPNEIFATEVVSSMKNINWSQNSNGKSAKEELLSIFGSETDFHNALASFPKGSNAALVDSYLMIKNKGKYRQLGISTKGGIKGEGSAASITSLFKFLFDEGSMNFNGWGYEKDIRAAIKTSSQHNKLLDVIQNTIVPKMSTLGQNYWKSDPENLSYIIIFGGTSPASHKEIIQSMIRNKFMGKTYQTKVNSNSLISDFGNEISTNGVTELIMDLLDKQKYKFCQVNTTPKFIGNQISFTYAVQYPARFSGDVRIEPDVAGRGLRFHIMGSVK